ncbi:hypothetical protein FIBSPDRAFT_940643 [Athelia psychrophila]|uniref:Cytochrome P450 n=1 Tax=Athelia psychrophila TaxID=1759441 RepID=A0A167VKV9_9AGAM|nr:hypothetical protein FIBSPDRAFT_940643 [Fibularhizoctonia sp. CBS 109695]
MPRVLCGLQGQAPCGSHAVVSTACGPAPYRHNLTRSLGMRHVGSLAPVFARKAGDLRDQWAEIADAVPAGEKPPFVDVLAWLSRATLDVIGLAGFRYEFNALAPRAEDEAGDELAEAFATIFSTARKFRIMTILQVWFPLLRQFPTASTNPSPTAPQQQDLVAAQSTMRCIGTHLIDTRKAAVFVELASSKSSAIDGDSTVLGRGLLSRRRVGRVGVRARRAALSRLDHAIPTSAPWIGGDGVTRMGIEIRRGDIISVPIQAVNRGEGVWGADAGVFRPERWAASSSPSSDGDDEKHGGGGGGGGKTHGVPGLYAGILTFLNGNPLSGNRACIGYCVASSR